MSVDVDVDDPVLPRKQKIPRRFEKGNAPPEYNSTLKGMYRRVYYEALDRLVQAIKDRFNQIGYRMYGNMEAVLLRAVQKEDYSEEMEEVLKVYGDNLNGPNLQMQLDLLSNTAPVGLNNIFDIIKNIYKACLMHKRN